MKEVQVRSLTIELRSCKSATLQNYQTIFVPKSLGIIPSHYQSYVNIFQTLKYFIETSFLLIIQSNDT